MLLRPCSNIVEARDERMAGAPLVHALNVHHLEAWLIHLMLRIKVWVGGQARCRYSLNNCWMGKSTALGIGKDVDLNLPHATGELISQRSMMIVQAAKRLGVLHLHVLSLAWRKSSVIAIV